MAEVIDFQGAVDNIESDKPPVEVKRTDYSACTHRMGVLVDDVLRTVECSHCKEKLDPIQVLIDMARHFQRKRWRLDELREREKREATKGDRKRYFQALRHWIQDEGGVWHVRGRHRTRDGSRTVLAPCYAEIPEKGRETGPEPRGSICATCKARDNMPDSAKIVRANVRRAIGLSEVKSGGGGERKGDSDG